VVALDLVGALQATTHGLVESRWIGPTKQKSEWIKAARQATTADTVIRRLMTVRLNRDTLTVTYDLWLPVGASYSATSCDLRVLMDQPTESISPHDPPSRHDHS
jgi:hypothetical protein